MSNEEILKAIVEILYKQERAKVMMLNVGEFGLNEDNWKTSTDDYETLKKLAKEFGV